MLCGNKLINWVKTSKSKILWVGMKKELPLHRDLRRGQINPKLRIAFHAGHFSSVTAARFFNLVRPPIIIIETGQSAECNTRVYTCVYVYIRACIHVLYAYIVGV